MSYIGRGTESISNVEVLDNLTFDGSASYTLQKSSVNFVPSSANNLLISISGVVQQGNFSVSGSTITFDTTVSASDTCDWILHYGTGLITTVADGAITEAKLGSNAVTTAKINDASVSLAKLSATGTKDSTTFLRGDNTFAVPSGGTMVNSWKLTSSISTSSQPYTVASNWSSRESLIGGVMTEVSGVFSFPTTGIYCITSSFTFLSSSSGQDFNVAHHHTTDNSNYNIVAVSRVREGDASKNNTATTQSFFDVTDTSLCKIKFIIGGWGGTLTIEGDYNSSNVYFTRLGDT